MDAVGAQHLAARIRAGVRIGTTIEVLKDGAGDGLTPGDRGVVQGISLDGVLVNFERGFCIAIDPDVTIYRVPA
jgi:multidrug efflux pump subunit AcrA (membrane-fusion protein)